MLGEVVERRGGKRLSVQLEIRRKAEVARTLLHDLVIWYDNDLPSGSNVFVGAAAGAIADAATTGGTGQVGFTIDAQRIYVHPSYY